MSEKDIKPREGEKASCLVTEAEERKERKGEERRENEEEEEEERSGAASKCKELLITMLHLLLPSLLLRSLWLTQDEEEVSALCFFHVVSLGRIYGFY